jgi:DNA-binding PadR family transcriptional regulator
MSVSLAASLELSILVAIARLGREAYGLAVRDEVSASSGHDYSVGAIYTTLQRLEEKGLLSSRTTEPLAIRGGRSRREYTVTAAGRRAMRERQRAAATMWAGLSADLRPRRA